MVWTPEEKFQRMREHLQREGKRQPKEVRLSLIDECDPGDPLPWPYPGDYSINALASILRRFRDPELAIRSVTVAIRMAVEWFNRGYRGLMTQQSAETTELDPAVYQAWLEFIDDIESTEPLAIPASYRGSLTLQQYVHDRVGQITEEYHGNRHPLWELPAARYEGNHLFNILLRTKVRLDNFYDYGDDQTRIMDEEDYYSLGRLAYQALRNTAYEPVELPEAGRFWGFSQLVRWWEILQCLFPFRDVWGPPITFADIQHQQDTSDLGEYRYEEEVLQALSPFISAYAGNYYEGEEIAIVDGIAQETWWTFTSQHVAVIVVLYMYLQEPEDDVLQLGVQIQVNQDYPYRDLDPYDPDIERMEYFAHQAESLANRLPEILFDKLYEYSLDTPIEKVSSEIGHDIKWELSESR